MNKSFIRKEQIIFLALIFVSEIKLNIIKIRTIKKTEENNALSKLTSSNIYKIPSSNGYENLRK